MENNEELLDEELNSQEAQKIDPQQSIQKVKELTGGLNNKFLNAKNNKRTDVNGLNKNKNNDLNKKSIKIADRDKAPLGNNIAGKSKENKASTLPQKNSLQKKEGNTLTNVKDKITEKLGRGKGNSKALPGLPGKNKQETKGNLKVAVKQNFIQKLKLLLKSPAGPYIIAIAVAALVILLVLFLIFFLFSISSSASGYCSEGSLAGDIPMKTTNLSRSDFISLSKSYFESNNTAISSVFKEESNLGTIYDVCNNLNVNPEMIVIRARIEQSVSSECANNYWGYNMTNTGNKNCSFSSFEEGVETVAKNLSQYETLSAMNSRYAYLGDYWYNPGGSGSGGCYYYEYIKQYMSESRRNEVAKVCGSSAPSCTTSDSSGCTKTTEEDKNAYMQYQNSTSVNFRKKIFNIDSQQSGTSGAQCGYPNSEGLQMDAKTGFVMRTSRALLSNGYFYDSSTKFGIDGLEGECVWYARNRIKEIFAQNNINETWTVTGNAGTWCSSYEAQSNKPFEISRNILDARQGDIIVWSNQGYGHVAIIEQTPSSNPNGKYLISEGGLGFGPVKSVGCSNGSCTREKGVTANSASRHEYCERDGSGCQRMSEHGPGYLQTTGDSNFACLIHLIK